MSGQRRLLRIGEYLLRRACRRLPGDVREERYREWAAELPAILADPHIRFTPWRAVRMLGYAADTLRGTATTPLRTGRRTSRVTATLCFLLAGLSSVAWASWAIVRAPEHGLNYVELAWGLLVVAYALSQLRRSAERMSVLLTISTTLTAVAIWLWKAAEAPGDWVNYLVAGSLGLSLVALWLASRRSSTVTASWARRVPGRGARQ